MFTIYRSFVEACTYQCLRREKNYVSESEMWMAKWCSLFKNN